MAATLQGMSTAGSTEHSCLDTVPKIVMHAPSTTLENAAQHGDHNKMHCSIRVSHVILSSFLTVLPLCLLQVYNNQKSLTTRVFWKSGVGMALLDAAIAFFIPYYTIVASGQNSITDVYSVGKTVFVALLGAVTLEICVIARYWTLPFLIFVLLSYWLVYPFEILFPAIEKSIPYYDPGQWGVGQAVFKSPTFWFVQIVVALTCFGHRYLERAIVWLFHPQVNLLFISVYLLVA